MSVVGAVLTARGSVCVCESDAACRLWFCLQVYFVGNAPMAHLEISSSSTSSSLGSSETSIDGVGDSSGSSAPAAPPEKQVFFHLAQVRAN